MGILSASVSMTRYRITDEVPRDLWAEIPDRLKKNAFQDIDHTADERSFGWVSFENMLDPAWREAPPEKGEFLAFALRLDTRRVPAAVFKKHYQIALDQEFARAEEAGRKGVSRDRKKELREQVALRLRARTLPIPAVFDVVWNTTTNMVYLTSVQSKLKDLFEDQFTLSFDLHLEPVTPYTLAASAMGEERLKVLEDMEAAQFA